ncbi:MAG TPA: hypothetical protein VNN18_09135 [Candidatus Xenobia bacterium]|nr:hypothetical protein [Candidatus Xenobia bacterium]
MASLCPICEKRRGKRRCPGLPRSRWSHATQHPICPQCCGEQREVGIECPADCQYLVVAHRYEAERREPPAELAFPKVEIDRRFLQEKQALVTGLSLYLVRLAAENSDVRDEDALAALDSLAKSYQTLDAGLYYEQAPAGAAAQRVAAALKQYLEQFSQEQQKQAGSSLRPGDALRALVFLLRWGQVEGNGRPLSRRFLDFLRAQFPAEARAPELPRIILPGA